MRVGLLGLLIAASFAPGCVRPGIVGDVQQFRVPDGGIVSMGMSSLELVAVLGMPDTEDPVNTAWDHPEYPHDDSGQWGTRWRWSESLPMLTVSLDQSHRAWRLYVWPDGRWPKKCPPLPIQLPCGVDVWPPRGWHPPPRR